MSITCKSGVQPFRGTDNSAIIDDTDYECNSRPFSLPLVTIGSLNQSLSELRLQTGAFIILINFQTNPPKQTKISGEGTFIDALFAGNNLIVSYIAEDNNIYIITKTSSPNGISSVFKETLRRNLPNYPTSVTNLTLEQNIVEVPIILMEGQTLIDGSDIGNMIFTIKDEFTYYDHKIPKHANQCQQYFIDPALLKTTIFDQCCPKIASVVKGQGNNLYEKLSYLYGEGNFEIDFGIFYQNVFFYAMLKYILARLLYGNFDVNYLLGKYQNKFLKDLGKSRFCGSLPLFTECVGDICIYNYNQYFLYK